MARLRGGLVVLERFDRKATMRRVSAMVIVALTCTLCAAQQVSQSIYDNGNVGIGTTSPGQKLDVSGVGLFEWVGGSTGAVYLGDGNHGIKSTAGSGVTIFTYGIPSGFFLQQGTGKVGIGTTTPSGKLDVAGDVYTSSVGARYDYSNTAFTPNSQMRRIYFYVDTGGETPSHYWKIATLQVTSDGWSGGAIAAKVFAGQSNRGGSSAEFTLFTSKAPGGGLLTNLAEYGVATGNIAYKYRPNAGGSYLDAIDVYAIGGWYKTIYGYIDIAGSSGVTYSVWSNGTDTGSGVPSGTDLVKNSAYQVSANSWTFTPPNGSSFAVNSIGNVGIGTANPSQRLEVAGNARVDGSLQFADGTNQATAWTGVLCGGDYAESVGVSGERTKYEPGDVIVIDPANPENFLKSSRPYATSVAGVYSTKPGALGRRSTDPDRVKSEIPMAMVGIVPTKVSTENGPVKLGDLLVTSSTPGYAMKGTDRGQMLGAVVGKALGSLSNGNGVINVLVTLQ